MSDQSYWGWAAKGLGGCINLCAMLLQEQSYPNADHLRMLQESLERLHRMLSAIVAEARKREGN